MSKVSVTFYFIIFHCFLVCDTNRCYKISGESLNYHLIHRNSRSTAQILSQKQFSSTNECRGYAKRKKALAFNYYTKPIDDLLSNCQVLNCPEININSSLINETGVKYYSLYSSRSLSKLAVNITIHCLPSVGIFAVSRKPENYTQARDTCKKMQGKLAHIANEERSVGLAHFIIDAPAFVGLSNRPNGRDERLWKNEFDEPLSCFDYRGWAKGEPSVSRGCVTLMNSFKSIAPTWKVVHCSKSFNFICEISPSFTGTQRKIENKNVTIH